MIEESSMGLVRRGISNVDQLRKTIYAEMVRDYERAAKKFYKELGGSGSFELKARWKHKEFDRRATIMANSISKTVHKWLEKRKLENSETYLEDRTTYLDYKAKQLGELVHAEGGFHAQVDLLVYSGVVDPSRARVMLWVTYGDQPPISPCPVCIDLESGNPYTIEEATTLGPKAHPNCIDSWEGDWSVDEMLISNTKRQVKDGEIKIWNGSSRTPAAETVAQTHPQMLRAPGGWAGLKQAQLKLKRT